MMFYTTEEVTRDLMQFELISGSHIGITLQDDPEVTDYTWVCLYSDIFDAPICKDIKNVTTDQINELTKRINEYIEKCRIPLVDKMPSGELNYTVYEEYSGKYGWHWRMETDHPKDIEYYFKNYKTWRNMYIYNQKEQNITRFNQLQGPIQTPVQ